MTAMLKQFAFPPNQENMIVSVKMVFEVVVENVEISTNVKKIFTTVSQTKNASILKAILNVKYSQLNRSLIYHHALIEGRCFKTKRPSNMKHILIRIGQIFTLVLNSVSIILSRYM